MSSQASRTSPLHLLHISAAGSLGWACVSKSVAKREQWILLPATTSESSLSPVQDQPWLPSLPQNFSWSQEQDVRVSRKGSTAEQDWGATGTLALQAVRSAANGIIFHHLLLLQRVVRSENRLTVV